MKYLVIVLIAIFIESCVALIVPQEVPSILSLVYSTIPQVRKGTDSRIGFGFRLGDHADFQVMFELGPQKDTRPIGSDASTSTNSKRQISNEEYEHIVEKSPNKEGTSYLMNWSNDMNAKKTIPTPSTTVEPDGVKGMNRFVQTTPLISESALKQLQLLYKKAHKANNNDSDQVGDQQVITSQNIIDSQKTSNQKPDSKNKDKITPDLMDVSLE